MAVNKKGLFANRESPINSQTSAVSDISSVLGKLKGGIQIGRVKDIILNTDYPNIDKFGGDTAIGTIKFELTDFRSSKEQLAKPLVPQVSAYPLINELVLLFKLPNTSIGKNTSQKSYYYMNMVSLWNHPHHNAYPNPSTEDSLIPDTLNDYQDTENGIVRKVKDKNTDINLNSPVNITQETFIEKTNIHPLLPFAGDVIHEGRWGNSIRLGSTNITKDGTPVNTWSTGSTSGDPITIFRNGQPLDSSVQGWKHIVEDINKDLTSIYLTSNQKLPLTFNLPYKVNSYEEDLTPIPDYTDPQILMNSNRIVLNAKKDSILLRAPKSVGISTQSSLNIDTKNTIISSGNIQLGSKDAQYAVVRGDLLVSSLYALTTALMEITSMLKTSVKVTDPSIVTADKAKNSIYANAEETIQLIQDNLMSMLSENVKTI